MSYLLSINQSHAVNDGNNSTFIYELPYTGSTMFQSAQIAVQSVMFYNSIYNIDALRYRNNKLSITMPKGSTSVTLDITIKDGLYTIPDLNAYIRGKLRELGGCLFDVDGNEVHFIQLAENQTYYAAQLDLSVVPSSGSYTFPSSGVYTSPSDLPSTPKTPTITVPENFSDIIGFNAGTYPATAQSTQYTKLSDKVPMVNPITSFQLRTSLIKNPFSMPSDVLCSFTKGETPIGKPIEYTPPEHAYIDCSSGSYSQIRFQIVDQNGNQICIREPTVNINVLIRQKN